MGDDSESAVSRDELVRATLMAMRAFGDALDRMHGGIRGDMDMNASDLAALRMIVIREQRGEWVSPHEIADHLAISTASTTKLLDRLAARGHIERLPHPRDGRARIVAITDSARQEVGRHFSQRMGRMRAAMESFDDDDLRAVVRFLGEMEHAVGE